MKILRILLLIVAIAFLHTSWKSGHSYKQKSLAKVTGFSSLNSTKPSSDLKKNQVKNHGVNIWSKP
jgi:hypothetical protein